MAEGMEAASLYVTVRAITAQFEAAMAKVNGQLAGTAAAFSKTGKSLKEAGDKMTRHLTLPILGVAAAGAKMALDFHAQMLLVQTQAGGSAKDVALLSKEVLGLAKSTTQGPGELARGMFHLKSLGLDNATAFKVLTQAAHGAQVGQADLEETVNALGGAVRTNIAGAKNYNRAMGTINATVGAGNMRMNDLTDALASGILPTAKLAGLSLRGVGAALATMTDENIPARVAANRMRTALMMMQAPSKQAEGAMQALGFTSKEVGDKVRSSGGIVSALQMIHDKYEQTRKSVGNTQAFADMARAFGGSKSASTIMLLANNIGVLRQKYEQIGKTANNFNSDYAASQTNALNKLHEAWSSVQVALIQIGDVVVPMFASFAQKVAAVADAFSRLSPTVQHMIVVGALLVAALGPALSIIGSLSVAIGFLLTPVGLVIVALAALGIGLVLLYRHSQTFRDIVSASFHAVEVAVSASMAAIKAVVNAVLNQVRIFWQRNGDEIKQIVHGIERVVSAAWRAIAAVTRAVWPVIEAEVRAAWNVIKAVVSTGVKLIQDIIAVALAVITGHWGKAWASLKKLASDAIHGLGAIIKAALTGIVSIAKAAAVSIGKGIVDGIIAGTVGLAGELAGKLKGAVGGAISSVKGAFHIHSPSRTTRDEIGKPLAQGIIEGATKLDELSYGITRRLRAALDAAKNQVTSYRNTMADAWRKLAGDADQAFNAETQKLLNNLRASLDQQLNAIESKLKSKLASIRVQGAALTPSEQAANSLQSQIQGQQDAKALADAQAQLAQAQGSGDQGQIAEAQYNLQQVQEQQQLQQLQAQAATERAARDRQTKAKEAAAQAAAAREKAAARKRYEQHRADLEAERKLEKKSMDTRLADLQKALAKDPFAFSSAHKAVMKLLKKTIGPELFKSGNKLGNEFADGIKSAMSEVEKASASMAAVVAKYLKLHSPAEAGPLSTLDHWWDAFSPTLLKGFNTGKLRSAVTLAAMPLPALATAGVAGAVVGGAGARNVIHLENHQHTHLNGREIAHDVRDVLVREGRYNGGNMLRGQG